MKVLMGKGFSYFRSPAVLGVCLAAALLPVLGQSQTRLPIQWDYNPVTAVEAISLSRDGNLLAVGGFNGVQVYRRSTGVLQATIPQSAYGFVTTVALSPDGSLVALGMFMDTYRGGDYAPQPVYGGIVEIHNASTGKLIKQIPTSATFATDSVAFSPDGRTLVDGGRSYDSNTHVESGVLELWDLNTGYRRKSLATTLSGVLSVAFSKDGTRLAAGGYSNISGGLELWDLKANKVIESFPTAASLGVASLAFSPDGKTIVDGGYTGGTAQQVNEIGVIEVWNVASGKLVSSPVTTSSQITAVAISPDGKSLTDVGFPPLSATRGVVEIRSLRTGNQLGTLDTTSTGVSAVCYSPDGKQILIGCSRASVETWDATSQVLDSTLRTAAFGNCESVRFSPDGKTLGLGAYVNGGAIVLVNAQTGKTEGTLSSSAHTPISIAFSPDGQTVASCGEAVNPEIGILELWNYKLGKLSVSLPTTATSLSATSFSPNGKLIADVGRGKSGGVVEIWNVSSDSVAQSLPTQAQWNNSVAFSPDGSMLATGGSIDNVTSNTYTGVVEIWNVATGKPIANLATSVTNVSQVTFSPDGKLLLVGGFSEPNTLSGFNGALEAWDMTNQKLKSSLSLTAHTQYLYSLCFAKDGKTIYAGTDLDFEAFSAANFRQLATFAVGGVNTAAISPSGSSLALNSLYGWLGVCAVPYLH